MKIGGKEVQYLCPICGWYGNEPAYRRMWKDITYPACPSDCIKENGNPAVLELRYTPDFTL